MGNVSYDTLSIKIEADSKQANTSIKNLSTSLRGLDDTVKKLDTARLIEVRGLLQSIAKIDFSNVTKGLQSIVTAFKSLTTKTASKSIEKSLGVGLQTDYPVKTDTASVESKISDLSFKSATQSLQEYDNTLKEISSNFKEVVSYAEQVSQFVFSPMDALSNSLEKIGLNGKQVQAIISAINYETDSFNGAEIERVTQQLLEMGYSTEKVDEVISRLKKDIDKLSNNKGTNGLKKLINQFNKIMKYRIIRKIIQEIYKALSEGVKNIIAFDEATANTVNELKSKFEFVKNSLGAMLAPLIQLIAPVLKAIMEIVGDIGNQFADMFAGFNGQEQFASATDAVKDFNEEAKKTKALGIDELNVLQQEDQSGSFEYKHTTEMSSDFKNAMSGITDILKSLLPMLKMITESFGELLKSVGMLVNALVPILKVIIELVNGVLGYIAVLVNKILASVIKVIAKVVEIIGAVIKFIEPIVDTLVNIIGFVVDIVTDVVDVVADLINETLQPLIDLIKMVYEFVAPIIKTLTNIFKGILTFIKTIFSGLLHGIGDMLSGLISLLGTLVGWIGNIVKFFTGNTGNKDVNKGVRIGAGILTGGISEIWKLVAGWFGVKLFANGGFPEDGFFYANHNELVGQFSNGKTAVANNMQITEGIYRAVRDAMKESVGRGEVIINLDGRQIAKAVSKQQDGFGGKTVYGNTQNWGK